MRSVNGAHLGRLLGDWTASGTTGPGYARLAAALRLLVLDGRLPLGTRLPGERELADALSVSRASVREALRVLHYIGVVDVRPGEGTFVATTPPTPLDPSMYSLLSERTALLDLVEARRILEDGIVHLAARRATKDDLDALEEALTDREGELTSGKHDMAGDLQFHALLAEVTVRVRRATSGPRVARGTCRCPWRVSGACTSSLTTRRS